MPDITGLELCRHVRERERETYLPIIMVTALGADAERHAGFAAGADDYLTKPFHIQELLDRVRVWTRTRQYLKTSQARKEELAQGQTTLAMALTMSHGLTRLLMLVLNLLEVWESGGYAPADRQRLREELREAALALAERINTLTRSARVGATPGPSGGS